MTDTIDRIAPRYSEFNEVVDDNPFFFHTSPDDRHYIVQAGMRLRNFKHSIDQDLRYPDGWLMSSHDRWLTDHVLLEFTGQFNLHRKAIPLGLSLPEMEDGPGIVLESRREMADLLGMTVEHMTRGDIYGFAIYHSMCSSLGYNPPARVSLAKWRFFGRDKKEAITARTFTLMTNLMLAQAYEHPAREVRSNLLKHSVPNPDIPALEEADTPPAVVAEHNPFAESGKHEEAWSRKWMDRVREFPRQVYRAHDLIERLTAERSEPETDEQGRVLLRRREPSARLSEGPRKRYANFAEYAERMVSHA